MALSRAKSFENVRVFSAGTVEGKGTVIFNKVDVMLLEKLREVFFHYYSFSKLLFSQRLDERMAVSPKSSDSWSSELGGVPRISPTHSSIAEEGEEERVIEREDGEEEEPLRLENARLNDCFINAVVQLLRGIPLFVEELEKGVKDLNSPVRQAISMELLRLLKSSGRQSVSEFFERLFK